MIDLKVSENLERILLENIGNFGKCNKINFSSTLSHKVSPEEIIVGYETNSNLETNLGKICVQYFFDFEDTEDYLSFSCTKRYDDLNELEAQFLKKSLIKHEKLKDIISNIPDSLSISPKGIRIRIKPAAENLKFIINKYFSLKQKIYEAHKEYEKKLNELY